MTEPWSNCWLRRALELILAAVIAAQSTIPVNAGAQATILRPPMPFVDSGACPFEGCQYAQWQASSPVKIFQSRSTKSPVVYRIAAGTTVEALTGIVVTEAPGVVVFRDSVTLGTASAPIHIARGDTLFLLTYEGEGFTTAWFRGRTYRNVDGGVAIFNAGCDTEPERCVGHIKVRPRQVWWVFVKDASGRTGWTNEPERFGGKDALGS